MIHEERAPDQQLLDLLRPIWQAANRLPEVPPQAVARAQALYRASHFQPRRARGSPWRLHPLVRPRLLTAWSAAVVLGCLFVLSGGVGVAVAAQPALPGERLYSVKTSVEQVRLAVAGSEGGRAELHLEFAQSRVEEILELTVRGRYDWIASTAAAYESEMGQASTELAVAAQREGRQVEPLAVRAGTLTERFSTALASVAGTTPREPQEALEHAVGVSATVKQKVAEVMLVITRPTPTPTPPLVPSGTATLLPTETPRSASTPSATPLALTETPTGEAGATPTVAAGLGSPTIPPSASETPVPTEEMEPPGNRPPGLTGTPLPPNALPPTGTPVAPGPGVPSPPPGLTDTPVPPDTPAPTKTKPHPPPSPPPPTRKPTNTPKPHPTHKP